MMPGFVAQKLALARRQLQSARSNFAQNDIETAANRAFLAAENAAAAAISKSGKRVLPIHGQIRADFEDLCDRGAISERFKKLLAESYRFRLRADYGRGIHGRQTIPKLTPNTVQDVINRVADLVDVVAMMPRTRRTRM